MIHQPIAIFQSKRGKNKSATFVYLEVVGVELGVGKSLPSLLAVCIGSLPDGGVLRRVRLSAEPSTFDELFTKRSKLISSDRSSLNKYFLAPYL